MLFNLPDEVLRDLVQDWLEPEEWGRLDSATCSKLCRELLLNSFRGLSYPSFQQDICRLTWLKSRNIFASWILVDRTLFSHVSLLNYLCQGVKRVEINSLTCLESASIINQCPRLTALTFYSADCLRAMNVDLVKQLQDLEVHITAENEQIVHQHCRELRRLIQRPALYEGSHILSLDIFKLNPLDIFKLNPHLHTVQLVTDNQMISDMAQGHYPSLTSLTLMGATDFSAVAKILRNNKTIVQFCTRGAFSCEYRQEDGYFSVESPSLPVGWAEFAQDIKNVQCIEWTFRTSTV